MNHAPTTGPSQLAVTTPVHTLPVKLCNIPQLNKQHQLIKSSKFLIILCGYLQRDLEYKPYVTAEPDVKTVTLNGSEDFLILGCDGLWDFVSENEVLYAIYQQIRDAPGNSHKKYIHTTAVLHLILKLRENQFSSYRYIIMPPHFTPPSLSDTSIVQGVFPASKPPVLSDVEPCLRPPARCDGHPWLSTPS
uniref:PPM-type phosphatase domain-containing protein n=1 Tax=Timema bartmani TaxID=61472 RepID=A0A7R9I4Q5_9NEOP|nr:unnamed protein product [Timema bartmani]